MAKKRMNYFETNIQKFGEDFLDYKRVDEIQKDCKYLFRDMVFGNINYEKHGMYFLEPRFLEQLLIQSQIEARNHFIKRDALYQYNLNCNDDQGDQQLTIAQLTYIENDMGIIMDTIYNYLNHVKAYNDTSCLIFLPAVLKNFRKTMKNY